MCSLHFKIFLALQEVQKYAKGRQLHSEKIILTFIGNTKKRPEQPGTAQVLEITPVVLEYCLNQIFVEIIY